MTPRKKRKSNKNTLGERAADKVSQIIGSWTFLIIQSLILGLWVILNVIAWNYKWDPYPFIFLNLALSFQAAYATPILLIAANRHDRADRELAKKDYQTDLEAKKLIEKVHAHLAYQDQILEDIKKEVEDKK